MFLHLASRFFFILCDQDLAYSSSLGSRLLMAVYKSIAPGENRKSLPSMDVSSRKLANGLVQLAVSLGDQARITIQAFLWKFLFITFRWPAMNAMSITCKNNFVCFINRQSSWWVCCSTRSPCQCLYLEAWILTSSASPMENISTAFSKTPPMKNFYGGWTNPYLCCLLQRLRVLAW